MKFSEAEPDPPYADHDTSVIQSKRRCVRRLAILSLFPVFSFLVTFVEAQSLTPDNIAERTSLHKLQRALDRSRARLEERLDAGKVSPEQGANLIEAFLVLGRMRRSMMGQYYAWRRRQKNLRQSTLEDYYDTMNRFNHRLAFATITARSQ